MRVRRSASAPPVRRRSRSSVCVTLGNCDSAPISVIWGVHPGSPLVQIHWISFSNPLDSIFKSIGFHFQIHWISFSNPLDFVFKSIGFCRQVRLNVTWIAIRLMQCYGSPKHAVYLLRAKLRRRNGTHRTNGTHETVADGTQGTIASIASNPLFGASYCIFNTPIWCKLWYNARQQD